MSRMTKLMKQIERERQQPLPDVIKELYQKYGQQTRVADDLGISQSTLSIWLVRLGLEEKTVKTVVEREKSS
jgi:transcriptional regulator with PAS, ATPase and Fis domain